MIRDFKNVCMTVAQPSLGQAHQPMLNDSCLELVGTDPAYLYGMQGSTNQVAHRCIVSERYGMPMLNRFAEMTFRFPVDSGLSMYGSELGLPFFDSKKAKKLQRNNLLDLFLMVLLQYYEVDEIQRTVGVVRYGTTRLDRMTVAYAQHLPDLMTVTDLKMIIVRMKSRHGFERSIAMIKRADIQTYVTDVRSDPGDRDFAYRIEDARGAAHHLELAPMHRTTVPHATTKEFRQPRMPIVAMTVVTDACHPEFAHPPCDVVQIDTTCARAIGSDVDWVSGYADHRFAPNTTSVATTMSDDLTKPVTHTKTLLTLVCSTQTWPDCSRDESLSTLPFFHPDFASAANLRVFVAMLKEEIERHERIEPHIAGMVFGDPRYELDELAMSYPIHVLGALERTGIDVAVLPKRWPDGTVTMMTIVRAHRLQHYLDSIETVGASKPVKYVMRYASDDQDPIWIETPGAQHERPLRPRMFEYLDEESDIDFDKEDRIICG